jgi:hypothetical protein
VADVIAPAHWQASRLALHTNSASTQQFASVAGVYAQQAKLKRVAQDAPNFFADTPQILDGQHARGLLPRERAHGHQRGVTLLEENRAYIVHVRDGPRRGKRTVPRIRADRAATRTTP